MVRKPENWVCGKPTTGKAKRCDTIGLPMEQVLKPLGGHEVLLLLLQLAALLVIARTGSEVVKRLGLPTVVGELAAGILLGPTVFGHFFPGTFAHLFPPVAAQFHLLEVVSTLGMVLL